MNEKKERKQFILEVDLDLRITHITHLRYVTHENLFQKGRVLILDKFSNNRSNMLSLDGQRELVI